MSATMRTLLAWTGGAVGSVLVLPIALIGLPFWAVAALSRWFKARLEPATVHWKDLIRFDPTVGWRPKPLMRAWCEAAGVDVFRVHTDAEGWCGGVSVEEAPVVVFGDSYAFGYGVNRPFFRVLPRGFSVKPIGAPGYSMVHEVLLMAELAPRLRGKLVVWFIYPGNDLTDKLAPAMTTWGYRMPFVREADNPDGWEIVTHHLRPERWAAGARYDRKRKVAAVFGGNAVSDRVYAACEYLIARGQRVCRQAGADLIVLTIPWDIQFTPMPWPGIADSTLEPHRPDRALAGICRRLGVRFVAGGRHFAPHHYIPQEGHLNDEGHRRLAAVLHDLYRSHGGEDHPAAWPPSVPALEEA